MNIQGNSKETQLSEYKNDKIDKNRPPLKKLGTTSDKLVWIKQYIIINKAIYKTVVNKGGKRLFWTLHDGWIVDEKNRFPLNDVKKHKICKNNAAYNHKILQLIVSDNGANYTSVKFNIIDPCEVANMMANCAVNIDDLQQCSIFLLSYY